MKKIFFTCIALYSIIAVSYAQSSGSTNREKFGENLFTGGNLGLNFGTITYLEIAPILGYRFNDVLAAGIGGKYQFYKDKRYIPALKTELYGGSVFGRIYFLKSFFVHGEFEVLSLETAYWDPYQTLYHDKRFLIGTVLAGAGYRQAIGEKAYTNIMLLYNFNQTIYSPYDEFVFKFGLEIDL